MGKEKENKNTESSEKEINKFFDSKNYNTIIVKSEGHSKKENDISEIIISLIDGNLSKEERDSSLSSIKEQNNREILLSSIRTIENPDKKALLIAACWEVGFDFSDEFLMFIDLACSDSFEVALEALTVIETIDGEIVRSDLEKAKLKVIEKLKTDPDTSDLLRDLQRFINRRLHN